MYISHYFNLNAFYQATPSISQRYITMHRHYSISAHEIAYDSQDELYFLAD